MSDQAHPPLEPITTSIASVAPTTMPPSESYVAVRLDGLEARGNISAETKANLDRRIQNAMANGNLTGDVISKALNVIDEISDKALVAEFLKSGRGGISLLAKLDGLPTDLREKIVKNVAAKNLHIANLNQILDEYHNGGIDRERLEKIIKCLSKLGADGVYRALKNGGINELLRTAGGLAGGPGGGVSSVGVVGSGVVTPYTTGTTGLVLSTIQPADPKSNLVEFFSKLPKAQKDRYELIAAAVLQFAEDIRKEKEEEKKSNEELCASRRPFTLGSAETIQDLQDALETIINSYGDDISAAAGVIQTCLKFDIPGDNISVLEVIRALLGQAERAKNYAYANK